MLPAMITHNRDPKLIMIPAPKYLHWKQNFLQCRSLTVNWDVVTGECEALCNNMKLFHPVTFCFSQTEITMKNGLSGEIFFFKIVIFHF